MNSNVDNAQRGGGNGGASTLPVASPATATNATTNTTNNNSGLGSLFGSREETSRRNSRRSRPQPQIVPPPQTTTTPTPTEDEQGIFAELYSENPDPVNRNSPTAAEPEPEERSVSPARPPTTRGTSRRSPGRGSNRRNGVLGRLFRRSNSENHDG